jgi:serine protease Do
VNKQFAFLSFIAVSAALTGGGCATSRPNPKVDGQAVFSALQQAVAAAGKQAEPSLALVTIERGGGAPRQTVGGVTITGGDAGSAPVTGIMLTPKGHLLVPGVIKPDQDSRITVLVGQNEYTARAVKADDGLAMSILKLDSDETFVPLDISKGADLAIGEWAILLKPTDEDSDYQKLTMPVVCLGERAGRYRRFLVNQSLTAAGSLVVNLSGQIVGVADRNTVMSLNDLREDVQRLVADATGEKSPEDAKQKQGWFGAMLEPINKEYAQTRKLSPSSLLVLYAVKRSPAAAAGLQAGDVIVALNGKPLRLSGLRALEYFVRSLNPRVGDKFALTVVRNGKPVELGGAFTKSPEPAVMRAEDLGVTVVAITDGEVFSQNLGTDCGVLVMDVHRGSPAANSGTLRKTLISRRDVIVELAGQPTPTLEAFGKALETIRRDQPSVVLVKYYRGLMTGYAGLNLSLGEKDTGNKQ